MGMAHWRDGTFWSSSMGFTRTGRWRVENDLLIDVETEFDSGCDEVWASSKNIELLSSTMRDTRPRPAMVPRLDMQAISRRRCPAVFADAAGQAIDAGHHQPVARSEGVEDHL
jgi:hypothetical protein